MNLHSKSAQAPAQLQPDAQRVSEVVTGLTRDISEMDLTTLAAQERAEALLEEALHVLRSLRPAPRPTWPAPIEARAGVL